MIEIFYLETGVNGIMCAEGNLYNPCLFAGVSPMASQICMEFLDVLHKHSYPTLSSVRGHFFKEKFRPNRNDKFFNVGSVKNNVENNRSVKPLLVFRILSTG